MCYKNVARWGSNTKCMHGLQEYRSAAADSNTKMLFCCSAFQLQRSGILVESN